MRHSLGIACMLFLVCLSASGQTPATVTPRFEAYGGYSYVSTDLLETPGVVPGGRGSFPGGWNAQFIFDASHNVGFVADFGGQYGSQDIGDFGKVTANYHSFLFGPKFTHHADKFEMSVHGLFGFSHATIDAPNGAGKKSDTDFALAIGGGLDYVASPHFAIRVVQGDYMMSQLYSSIENTIRVSTGIVLRW